MQIYRSLDEVVEVGAIAATTATIVPDSIVNADCLEAMKFIPDKSIDCIICDLPYGVTALKWDLVIPFDLLWEQYKRIIKPNGAIVLFSSQPFTSALVMSNPKWFKYEWIWEKSNGSNFASVNRMPFKVHENILVFYNKQPNYNPQKTFNISNRVKAVKHSKSDKMGVYGSIKRNELDQYDKTRYPRSVQKIKHEGRNNQFTDKYNFHPTQKSCAVYEYLIKTYTLENELILDNTAGSGTLAIAAMNTNRRYICIEKDPDYFEVMLNRIENHDPNAPVTPKKTRKPKAITEGQLSLFG